MASSPRSARPVRQAPTVLDALAVVALAVFGLVYPPSKFGLGLLLLVGLSGIVVAAAVFLVRGVWRLVAFVVAFFAGMVAWGQAEGFGVVPTWLAGLLLGGIVAADIVWFAQRRTGSRRAPAATVSSSRIQVTWDEGRQDQENRAPDESTVLGLVERLDGRDRTAVSILRGHARLDVGGDAGGPMVVFQSDDRRTWHQVRPGETVHGKERQEVDVEVGRMTGHYPTSEVTDLDSARTAVRTFLASGTRDSSLPWFTETRHDEVVRPPSLQATD